MSKIRNIVKENTTRIASVFNRTEVILYLAGTFSSAFLKTNLIMYAAFLATVFFEIKKYRDTRNFFHTFKILIMSIIIPNNYIIILVVSLLCILCRKNILDSLKKLNFKRIGPLILLIFIYITLSLSSPLNLLFGLFYLAPVLLVFLLLNGNSTQLKNAWDKTVQLVKILVIYELIANLVIALSEINILISGVIANDWIAGTFGLFQGNIFLYYMFFSLLVLKKDYDQSKAKQNIGYIIITIVLSIATNSISLIVMFIFAYFVITFIESNRREKLRSLLIMATVLVLFFLLTPAWSRSYLLKLTNPTYFSKNVAKVQVYEDTFINIPIKDIKFAIVGNGIGQYSSRAALTCTGKYVDIYNKIFSPSISDYTARYILNRYEYYNLELTHGTLYSPFSTILSIQGEYGIIGMLLFICLIIYLMRKQSPYTKIFVLFFFLSCFIENYLEFVKIMTMLFSIYFINRNSVHYKERLQKNKDSRKIQIIKKFSNKPSGVTNNKRHPMQQAEDSR